MIRPTEPGYYKDGEYGIRIENIVIVREAQTPNNFGDKGYLRFEHVTMVCSALSQLVHIWVLTACMDEQCPMGKNLVDVPLLSVKEREWLDAYHAEIEQKVAPLVEKDERALRWLKRECSPL